MSDKQINTYTKGFTPDIDPRRIGPDQLSDAQDIEFMSDGAGSSLSIEPLKSMLEAYTVPAAEPQPLMVRLNIVDNTTIVIKNTDGSIVASFFIPNKYTIVGTLNDGLAAYGIYVLPNGVETDYIAISFAQTITPNYNPWIIEQDGVLSPILQMAIPYQTTLYQRGSLYLDDKLFVFSSSSSIGEIGVVEELLGTYLYTRLMRSSEIVFPGDKVIDVRGESIADNKWGLYFTYGSKPRVLYVSKDIAEDSVYKYTQYNFVTGTSGYIVGGYEEQQTSLQLFAPELRVEYNDQIQAGGSLPSGGYFYAVRAGVNGVENTTPWSFVTPNAIPVYVETFNSKSNFINIQGDKSGTPTTKINQLLVSGIPNYTFDYIELACIYDAGGSKTAYIVDKFKVSSSSIIVNHTGTETKTELDTAELPEYFSVIKTAESLEIKRNRLNIADVSIESDTDYTEGFSGINLEQGKEDIGAVGQLESAMTRASGYNLVQSIPETSSTNYNGLVLSDITLDPASEISQGAYGLVFTSNSTSERIFNFNFNINYVNDVNPDSIISLYVYRNGYGPSGGSVSFIKDLSVGVNSFTYNEELLPGDFLNFRYETGPLPSGQLITLKDVVFNVSIYSDLSQTYSKPGEYQNPLNCAKKVGYTLNESYPFYARVHYKSGYISSPYLMGTSAFLFTDEIPGFNNDTDLFTNQNKSDFKVYSRHLKVSGFSFLLSDPNVLGVSIWRGVCNPTILGTGVSLATDNFFANGFNTGDYASIPVSNGKYELDVPLTDAKRSFGMFVSPDVRSNKTQPTDGDKIILYGCPLWIQNSNGITSGSKIGSWAEYGGSTFLNVKKEMSVFDATYQGFNKKGTVVLTDDNGSYYFPNTSILDNCNGSQEGIAFSLDNKVDRLSAPASGFDNGVYISQYYRPLENQYNLDNINIIYTGCYIPKSEFGSTANVFGGDTYTQKNILKLRYWSTYDNINIRSSFITYYGQSKFNTQLGYSDYTVPSTMNLYGQKSIQKYLFPYTDQTQVAEDQFNFDAGFSAYNNVNVLRPYDKNLASGSDQPTTIYYSPQKPFTSIQDFYRTLKPFDTAELDPKNGRIVGLLDVQDYMMVLQPRAVTILPYSSDAFVNTTAGNVQTSSGSVYPNARRIVTTYGPSTKSAIINAQNRNGNAQPYWYSDKYYKLCRYGADGVSLLSDIHGFRTYFLENFTADTYEFENLMGYHPRKQQLYVTESGKVLGWNEVFNMSTGKYTFGNGLTRFFTFRDKLFAIYGDTAYSVAEGEDWLQWPNGVQGQFVAESVFNKNAIADKRALSAAFAVGNSWNSPGTEVTFSSDTNSSISTEEDLIYRRSSIITHAKRGINGQEAIIGQYIKVKIAAVNYVRLAATTITALVKGRRP